jgi:hypothetical protein
MRRRRWLVVRAAGFGRDTAGRDPGCGEQRRGRGVTDGLRGRDERNLEDDADGRADLNGYGHGNESLADRRADGR